jgi:ribosomal protein S18 acetylase RimI-like enzyme
MDYGDPMSQDYKITVELEPDAAEIGMVADRLAAYNASKANGEMPNYLFITMRGDDGSIVGGVVGATYLGWLQVHVVWVADELRGLDYGTRLMQEAESEAIRRGCPRVFLETFNFQALPFYEKLGYEVFSKLADFPPGGARYALTKHLES